MARGNLQVVTDEGISPERARADHLAIQVEMIRTALAPLVEEIDRLYDAMHSAWSVLERLPRQTN